MSGEQIFFVAAAFVVLIAITLAAQLKWLKHGRTMTVLVFLAGVLVILALRFAELPPDWFSGEKDGFWMVVWFALSAFVLRGVEERAFGFPLLMGMALTLLAANVVALVAGAL